MTTEWVVVFVHGYDDDPASFEPRVRRMLPGAGVALVIPRGPFATAGTRASWFSNDEHGAAVAAEVRHSLDALEAAIGSAADDHAVARDHVIIGGFSQGACLSLACLLRAGGPPPGVAGLFGVAGWLLDAEGVELDLSRAAGLPVFLGHGADDEVVPLPLGRGAARALDRAGALVTFCEHDAGHELGPFAPDVAEWLVALEQGHPLERPPA